MTQPGPAFGSKLLTNIEGRELRQARTILIVLGLLTGITQALWYGKLDKFAGASHLIDQLRYAAIAGIALGGVFIACGLAIFRKPMLSTVTGLTLYLASLSIQLYIEPSSLWNDVFSTGVRIAIVIGLVSAVQFARIYARTERARKDFPAASVVKS